MGNAVSPCFQLHNNSSNSTVKVIFSQQGTTRLLKGKHIAGEIMFEFPDQMVCHADSFFIGQPIRALSIDDHLILGHTYFVLPLDRFSGTILTASSLAALNSSNPSTGRNNSPIKFGETNPFEYIRASNGKVLIKVVPEFITRLITSGHEVGSESSGNQFLCNTPELQKHYEQLVGPRDQLWSPKLETISEHKARARLSPCRLIGLDYWKPKEMQVQWFN